MLVLLIGCSLGRAQYQIDEETDGAVWLTHPHPVLADSLESVENNQRIVKGSLEVSMRPFGNVSGYNSHVVVLGMGCEFVVQFYFLEVEIRSTTSFVASMSPADLLTSSAV